MAKFSYTQNGILFNNLDNAPDPIKPVGGKLFNTNNDYEHAADGIDMTIDAVTIDWNGANIANKTVNTTGELLKIINDLYGQVNNVKVSSIQLSQTSTWEPTKWPVEKKVYAYVYPDNAKNTNVHWECINNNSLVTFSSAYSSGYESYTIITLKNYGRGTVRCTALDGSGVYGQFDIYAHPDMSDRYITATILYGEGVQSGKSEEVTPAQIENANELTNISVDLTSPEKYSYFEYSYTSNHSLIIRLPNITEHIYPSSVQFQDNVSGELVWRNIGYLNSEQENENQIKTYYTSTYSYFVITSYAPHRDTYSDYRVNFTRNNPNYGTIGGPTAIPPTTPSSTSPS